MLAPGLCRDYASPCCQRQLPRVPPRGKRAKALGVRSPHPLPLRPGGACPAGPITLPAPRTAPGPRVWPSPKPWSSSVPPSLPPRPAPPTPPPLAPTPPPPRPLTLPLSPPQPPRSPPGRHLARGLRSARGRAGTAGTRGCRGSQASGVAAGPSSIVRAPAGFPPSRGLPPAHPQQAAPLCPAAEAAGSWAAPLSARRGGRIVRPIGRRDGQPWPPTPPHPGPGAGAGAFP